MKDLEKSKAADEAAKKYIVEVVDVLEFELKRAPWMNYPKKSLDYLKNSFELLQYWLRERE